MFLAVVAAGLLASCGGTSSTEQTTTAATPSSVLRMAAAHEISTWDPRTSYADECEYLANIYEPLLWANPPGSAEPFTPALAESWEVSNDGLAWTFHLRQGVKFHDGAPFDAAAVKYSIEATKKIGLGASYIWYPLKKIKIVDDYTVKLITSYPAPMDRVASSMYAAWMFSPNTKGKSEAWWNTPHEVGTGPWVLRSYQPGEEVILDRNADYWGGWKEGQFSQVVVKMVHDTTTQRQMLESGEADCANQLSYDDVPALQKNSDLTVVKVQSVLTEIMQFNTQRKPLSDVKVRQALSYAIPYEDLITVGANGFATQSRGPVAAGLWPNDPAVSQYSYDLAKAKQLLTEAGYGNGFSLNVTYATDDLFAPKYVALLKEAYGKIGVKINLQGLLFNQGWERAKGPEAKRQDIWIMMWWPGYPHGYDALYPLFHSEPAVTFNLSYWYNKDYDNLIDTAFSTEVTDHDKAAALYRQAQQVLVDQAPGAYIFDAQVVFGHLNTIKLGPMALNPNYTKVFSWYHVTH